LSDTVDLVLPNIAEFNLRHPALELGPGAEATFAALGTDLADQSVFWSDHKRVLVLPEGVDLAWLSDVHTVLGVDTPPVASPVRRDGLVLSDLLHDGTALAALRRALAGHAMVRFVTWGATPGLYVLAGVVSGWGHEILLDCTAQHDYWASLYFDSKISCLDLATRIPELAVPPGITVATVSELQGALTAVLAKHPKAIVKSMYGVGGEGAMVVRADGRGLTSFLRTMHREPFLRVFPLVVQPFLPHAPGVGCPAVDMLITDAGVDEIITSAMNVDGHRFRSVNVGAASTSADHAKRIVHLGLQIGMAAHALGYRGWFCIDYLADTDDRLYLTEINARRSGAAAAIALLQRWNAVTDLVVHSSDTVHVDIGNPSYRDDIRPVFQALWAEGVRVYPSTVRGLASSRPTIGVLSVGESRSQAEAVTERVAKALATR
jgi:hypothetical protein